MFGSWYNVSIEANAPSGERLWDVHGLGNWLDTACTAFREAEKETAPGSVPFSWSDRLEIRMLRGEADALIVWDPIFPADPFAR